MMILFDTCVVLDYLLDRDGFADEAESLIMKLIHREIIGVITVKSLMDIYYVVKHNLNDEKKTRSVIAQILEYFVLMESFADDAVHALKSNINDYEDAVMVSAAMTMEAEGIVTRNTKDFKNAGVKVYTPAELLGSIT